MVFCQFALVLLGLAPVAERIGGRVMFVVLLAGYEVLYVARVGQTPGKDLCRVRVVDVHTGLPPGVPASLLRWPLPVAAVAVPSLPAAAAAVAVLAVPALLRADRRALHDLLARTRVAAYHADVEEQLEDPDVEQLDRLRRERGLFRRLYRR